MPWVDGRWVDEQDSVSKNLTGLLDQNSDYIKQARAQGERAAGKRGLLNSSIAAGSGQSAAIAAALPIASQDATIASQKNQTQAEFVNQTKLNDQTITGQKDLAAINNAAELARQKEAQGFQLTQQEKDNIAQMDRLTANLSSQERQALLSSETSLKAAQIQSSDNLSGNYLSALSNLMANGKVPAATRNQLIAEYQRVTQQSAQLRSNLAKVSISW